ncbi:MAG: TIGR02710 family CRISPR-associated CARF protein [Nitrospiraceae bacterium]
MVKAFVQSVGTGTRPEQDITQPLMWHWKNSGAGYTVWVVSEQSYPLAEQMASRLGLAPSEYRIVTLRDKEDVEAAYRDCRALFRDLDTSGYPLDRVEVDYTSGTKAMTAGLVLAAVASRCGTLSYIGGTRQGGVVVSGTERLVPIEPRRIWADEGLRLGREFCRALRFDAALTLIDGVQREWLGEEERRFAEGLRLVATGYGAWDRFEYARAVGELTKLADDPVAELEEFTPDRMIVKRLPNLKPERGLSADRLADLFNNAGRRLSEGRYDDALARFYRLAEMFAQWILRKDFGIDTADVAVEKVPEALRVKLVSGRDIDCAIQIGLEWDYRLLSALGHEAGRRFDHGEFAGIGVLLKKRNGSLLAHGLEPIARQDVESLQKKLAGLIATEVPDVGERCAALEFPWRRSRS